MSRSSQSELSDLSTPLNELFKQKSTPGDEVTARDSKESTEMWSIYKEEAEKYDEAVTEAQKKDADGVLVFTGLFSATVAVFIVESYKLLSPDSGNTTTYLLTQITQQLAGFKNNAYPQPQGPAAFSPTVSILFVNALWFLSLVIAIVSAFYVMLVQQWIRRYTQTLADLKLTTDQERVRSCLFLGTQKYKMSHAIGLIPLPLHISVFLFFSGLIVFLFTISNAIAIVITVAVVLIGLLYAGLTILPITDDVCPYFTPMSDVWWYIQHSIVSAGVSGCHLALEQFRNRSGAIIGARPGRLSNWSDFLKDTIDRNRGHLKDGLRGNIFRHAKTAPVDVDLSTLTWLLQRPIMGEKGKLQGFIESIPPQILVQLSFLEAESGKKTIRDHLFNLFQDCLGNKDKLQPKERSQRLGICLDAFYQIVKPSSFLDKDPEMVLQYVWSNFKDLDPVRKLWDDSDPAIRIFSRSICAHLSRNILRKSKPDKSEQSWLREFVGKQPEDAIFDPQLPNYLSTWDHFILVSFVYGVFPCLKDGFLVKHEHAACFVETLAVLMNAGNSGKLSKEIFSEEIFSFIEWAKDDDHVHHDEVAAKLDELFSKFFTDPTTNINDRAE
ncbi:hypothetical protein F5888DRAFT_827922 [Russula emetica]|nr:hypothetical protein F5888DRAFT_827922 [Russula emetica]